MQTNIPFLLTLFSFSVNFVAANPLPIEISTSSLLPRLDPNREPYRPVRPHSPKPHIHPNPPPTTTSDFNSKRIAQPSLSERGIGGFFHGIGNFFHGAEKKVEGAVVATEKKVASAATNVAKGAVNVGKEAVKDATQVANWAQGDGAALVQDVKGFAGSSMGKGILQNAGNVVKGIAKAAPVAAEAAAVLKLRDVGGRVWAA